MKLGAHGKWETKDAMREGNRSRGGDGVPESERMERGGGGGGGGVGGLKGAKSGSELTGLDMPRQGARPRPRHESLMRVSEMPHPSLL